MGTLEQVKKMQQQGASENEIISSLQQQGISYKDISDSLSQSKIKAAIEQPLDSNNYDNSENQQSNFPSSTQNIQQSPERGGMQQSIMQSQSSSEPMAYQYDENQNYPQDSIPSPNQQQDPNSSQYPDYGYYPEQSNNIYQSSGISPDIITEISEQIFSEKISEIRKKIEKITDFKTTFETKSEVFEDRLKRIEKIIDTLQTSVLRKVGDYITNVEDIKKELIETQKSFGKLSSKEQHSKHQGSHHKTHSKKHSKNK
jgi:hypothetical protein